MLISVISMQSAVAQTSLQFRMSFLDDEREASRKVSKCKIVARTMDVIADCDDIFVIATSYSAWRFIRKHIPFYQQLVAESIYFSPTRTSAREKKRGKISRR